MGKKVFYLIDHFKDPFAGTEGQIYALIKGLIDREIETEMAIFKQSEYITKKEFPCPVKTLNIEKMLSLNAIITLIKLAIYLKRKNYGLVHIYFNDASVIAPIILRCFGIKVIISRRDMGFWYTPLVSMILRVNSKFINACICNSHAVKNKTMEVEGIPNSKLSVVYNGLPDYKINKMEINQVKEINELAPEKNIIIGIVANIRPIKRISDLIHAAKILADENEFDFKIAIIGGGDDKELKDLCEQLKIADKVLFFGAKQNVGDYINIFDIAVLTSESEGLSNSIIEYMGFGKPVVCTDAGGNSELIQQGVNGYLYPVGDVHELAKSLNELLKSKDKCKKLGSNGRHKVEVEFSIDTMVNNTLKIYRNFGVGQC